MLGRSGNLGGQEVFGGRNYRQKLLAGNEYILQLHVDCLTYHSGDYRTESLGRITVHVQIHINISEEGVPGGMCQRSGGCCL
jgi:hypothetical protein